MIDPAERLGVARVSAGSGLFRAALAQAETLARDLFRDAGVARRPAHARD